MAQECCYTCENYDDRCQVSDRHDDVDPNTFSCELYEQDDEEMIYFD